MYKFLLSITLLWFIAYISINTMKTSANFYSSLGNQKAKVVLVKVFNMTILPIFLPFLVALIITISHNYFPVWPFAITGPNYFYFLIDVWVIGIISTIFTSLYVVFSGGSWEYQTKNGHADMRYKNNTFYPKYDNMTKRVAKQFLTLPAILAGLLVIALILKYFLTKK